MMSMQLSEAAGLLGADLVGADVRFAGVSTDSRSLEPGNLFVALVGERFDGHAYLQQAAERGAAAAAVSRELNPVLPLLRVADTRRALGELAGHWRRRFDLPLVAVTGSNGKTTVKEMTAAILGVGRRVLATRGNLNNDIGVPLTLFRLDGRHQAAVIEMGANHPGEIALLTGIAAPSVALITNAAPAHLAGFGDLAGVAEAKGEIFAGLGPHGVAVINADDRFAPRWRALAAGHEILDFGLEAPAAVSADWRPVEAGSELRLRTPQGRVELRLPLPGRHNVMNALAATAAALAAGAGLDEVQQGLSGLRAVAGRLRFLAGRQGARLIDDSYNANPASLGAALEVLRAQPGEHWLVLGEMGELGGDARALHAEAGRQARASGVSRLFGLGPLAAEAVRAFGAGARMYDALDALLEDLGAALDPDKTVLVKGSRSMRMERVVEALAAEGGSD
ncbi:UDP-N-acetylmuramoyl-tripeptide--D-alanyl-D-alanine ligase [Thiohalobacter sp. IOR34]|uniref:UDP-N-acetylmuramoyl-tripeptide--D-alanyl-D- alanine ligase n=1 Tax=Thiohalobacter sp. IOR34 TaxID=3057176 RepID=UPI0025B1AB82|nr:UDP-N-acetylmuramoyl-tripeptide--D-alanyl-D-alanine ligase [Thiohalobacter sp. IOR34]WJW75012.1 UDP-N-acetylmuramoyl-tripeptide--D-alanyl-D-alanine ligase [Thiohalobacter sp. IOR34]